MTDEKLNKEIGTKEMEALQPKKVKVESVSIDIVKDRNLEKVGCLCSHPDKEDPITISSVEYKKGKNLKTSGLWYKEDEDGNIQKGSALAVLLESADAKCIKDLEQKEIETVLDEKGYLCFKAY